MSAVELQCLKLQGCCLMKGPTDTAAVAVVVAGVDHDRFEQYPSSGCKQKTSFSLYLGTIVTG